MVAPPKIGESMSSESRPTAIDLYSGIGGWNLGLEMAGVQTLGSYEWWTRANETHRANATSLIHEVDIRKLPTFDLPGRVSFVVGSPPCTQFSFANRGGNGDIADGLVDIRKFLEIVRALNPPGWAMENVPRVAGILADELATGGTLHEFADLVRTVIVVDSSDFGLPQARKRMLAGSFDPALLRSYAAKQPRRTLGDVIEALRLDPIIDPIYGTELDAQLVTGREEEVPLDWEELRMNREAKRFHPVYNLMQFPDSLARPARTVTATCTRVSRESVVVQTSTGVRRLTLRERASLQSFPAGFQFPAKAYGDSLTMIGNAIPPLLTYFVAHALLGTPTGELSPPKLPSRGADTAIPTAKPEMPTRRASAKRRFRAALPNLRFGSGMRFELTNQVDATPTTWHVTFYYGPSKTFQAIEPREVTMRSLRGNSVIASAIGAAAPAFAQLGDRLERLSGQHIQDVWTHIEGGYHPYSLVDDLGAIARTVIDAIGDDADLSESLQRAGIPESVTTSAKGRVNAPAICAGLVVGSWLNARPMIARASVLETA
jgi:DNA (cytosine-5)-methyltransferase 1